MPIYIRKEQVWAVQMQTKGILETVHGGKDFEVGDYLVTGKDGQYIIKKDVFEQEYERLQQEEQDKMAKAYESAYQDEEYIKAIQEMY